jgi:DNA-binding CsgD family transcriptional regulator
VVDRALELAEVLPLSSELVATETLVAEAYMLANHHADAIEWADRALAAAAAAGVVSHEPRALVAKGTALLADPKRIAEGLAILDEAEAKAERTGDGVSLSRSLYNAIFHRTVDVPTADIWPVLWRLREAAERVGFDKLAGTGSAVLAVRAAVAEGDRATAEQYLSEAQRRSRWAVSGVELMSTVYWEAALALESGDLAQAQAALVRMTPPPGADHNDALDYYELALEAASQAGDRQEAATLLQTYVTARGDSAFCVDSAPAVVQSALRAGVPVGQVREIVAAWFRNPPMLPRRFAAHVQGVLLEAEGEHEAALAAYLDAVRPVVGLDAGWLRADVHQGAARSLLALDRVDEARVHAERAGDLLANWPGWRQREAAALVRRLDPRGSPTTGGPEALTAREREVVALLAEGLTNAELARRLYISTKTAAVHVSNILAKLGMSSRTEVAAWAVRQGLASA